MYCLRKQHSIGSQPMFIQRRLSTHVFELFASKDELRAYTEKTVKKT
jgi:hypothetical protein